MKEIILRLVVSLSVTNIYSVSVLFETILFLAMTRSGEAFLALPIYLLAQLFCLSKERLILRSVHESSPNKRVVLEIHIIRIVYYLIRLLFTLLTPSQYFQSSKTGLSSKGSGSQRKKNRV